MVIGDSTVHNILHILVQSGDSYYMKLSETEYIEVIDLLLIMSCLITFIDLIVKKH